MYIEDSLRSLIKLMETPEQCLTQRTYNIHAMDFTPTELAATIAKYVPGLQLSFVLCPTRQEIGKRTQDNSTLLSDNVCLPTDTHKADSWPFALNDDAARRDWNWTHHYNLDRLCKAMFVKLAQHETPSAFIKKETLLNAIREEEIEQVKYESVNDNRSILVN